MTWNFTVEGYVEDILMSYDMKGTADAEQGFHFGTAKLLHLAKQVRPDILTAIAFLTPEPELHKSILVSLSYSRSNGAKKFGMVPYT